MARRFIPHICFLGLVLSAAVPVQGKQLKADSDAAISQTLQVMEQDWLNAEKDHNAAAFGKLLQMTGSPSALMARRSSSC